MSNVYGIVLGVRQSIAEICVLLKLFAPRCVFFVLELSQFLYSGKLAPVYKDAEPAPHGTASN